MAIAKNVSKHMLKKIFIITLVLIFFIGAFFVLSKKETSNEKSEKISIISTLYPYYDFAKNIGGDFVEVTLLLPPGVEAHSFEPKPSDIIKINQAGIFLYTSEFMEPWAHDIIESTNNTSIIIEAADGLNLIEIKENEHEEEEKTEDDHNDEGVDPHVWLDFENAQKISRKILNVLTEIDTDNASYYENNYNSFIKELIKLDNLYKERLANCQSKQIIHGGHFAFGYLAKRYNLDYRAVLGFSPNTEPSARDLITLIEEVKNNSINYIFYEELASPKIAETLASETGTELLLLNGAHNITKEEMENKTSFISIMENNLENLVKGLSCKEVIWKTPFK